MAWRFSKSKKILPGLTLRVGKRGLGLRVGGRRGGVSIGGRGVRASAPIPGTGISVSQRLDGGPRSRKRKSGDDDFEYRESYPRGFFSRLVRGLVGVAVVTVGFGFVGSAMLIHDQVGNWMVPSLVGLIGLFFMLFSLRFFRA